MLLEPTRLASAVVLTAALTGALYPGFAVHSSPAEIVQAVNESVDARTAINAIRGALDRGDGVGALAAADAAVARHPDSSEVLTWAGHAQRLAGELQAAGRLYRRALVLAPESPEALMGLATLLETTGNPSAARDAYYRVLELAPESPAPRRPLATLAMRSGDHAAAVDHFTRWLEALPDDLEARYLLGMAHFLGGAHDQAIPVFESILGDRPDYLPAVYALGVVLADRPAEHTRARSLLERALDAGWEAANASYLLGRISAEQGHDEAAVAALERALAENRELIDAHYQLALALNRLGRVEEARVRMERFRTLQQEFNERETADKQLKTLRNELAAALGAGDEARALAIVDHLIAGFAAEPEALVQAAKVWMSTGRLQEAMDAAVAARQTDPAGWEAWYLEGILSLRSGAHRQATSRLRAALERNPLFPDVHAQLGNAYFALGEPAAAADAYLAAIDLDPDNPAYWLNLATAYEALGRGDLRADALDNYRSLSIREDPSP